MEQSANRGNMIRFWIGAGLILALFIVNDYINDKQLSNSIDERIETQKQLDKEKHQNFECVSLKDSLSRENERLSRYWTVTKAMIHRDEATSELKKIGEVVYMKSDSARGIIEDIVIGGSKYNYYVKYRIVFKDNSYAEVIPEMTY